jgi:predicted metal-dependent hydrolase
VLNTDARALPGVPRLTLHIGLPQTATPEQIRDAVQSWLQRQARRVFEERCKHFAQQLGVRYTRCRLSSAQTRWGSAGADGSIRLNWRLIHFAMPSIDYVVAHELAHLREMNHSPRFWDVVRSVMPDFEHVRETLKDDSSLCSIERGSGSKRPRGTPMQRWRGWPTTAFRRTWPPNGAARRSASRASCAIRRSTCACARRR